MTARNFVRVLEKGLAKAKYMGLEPAKIIKVKVKVKVKVKGKGKDKGKAKDPTKAADV